MADEPIKKINVVSASGTSQGALPGVPNTSSTASTAASADIEEDLDSDNGPFSDIKKELRTRFELLPEELQKVIMDDDYQLKLFNIAKAQKLTYEELGSLETETTMVLLGMTRPSEYRDELQLQLRKNDPEMDALVTAVNEQVFAPIRAALENLYTKKRDPEDFLPQNAVPATPAAQTATPAVGPSLSSTEKSVLEKTGVVISERPATPAAPAGPVPTRSDVLKGIENPPKAPSSSLMADKPRMTGPVISATKTTDYSVVKPSVPNTPASAGTATPKNPDPYREPIN